MQGWALTRSQGFDRIAGVNFYFKKIKRRCFSKKKKQKSTGCNRVFDRVNLPGHTRSWLFLFFLQPGPVLAPGRLDPGSTHRAWPDFKTVLESSAEGLDVVDELRAAVSENISLYMEKNEEEFKDYLNDFAQAVWTLLGNVSQSSSRDSLAVTAIKFLTTAIKSFNLPIAACKYPKVAHLYHWWCKISWEKIWNCFCFCFCFPV